VEQVGDDGLAREFVEYAPGESILLDVMVTDGEGNPIPASGTPTATDPDGEEATYYSMGDVVQVESFTGDHHDVGVAGASVRLRVKCPDETTIEEEARSGTPRKEERLSPGRCRPPWRRADAARWILILVPPHGRTHHLHPPARVISSSIGRETQNT